MTEPAGEEITSRLSEQVSNAIAEVLPSDDPLDRPDFDPVEYINQRFPTEIPKERLDSFVTQINSQVTVLDEEISRAVCTQAEAGERAARDISEAKVAILELHSKIKDIKEKAMQSELMVQEICCDIKQLDLAKRHLQTTITALKRLHMMVTAVDQLDSMAKNHQYREAAYLLEAVNQLLGHFLPYAEIPKIKELGDKVDKIKAALSDSIDIAFSEAVSFDAPDTVSSSLNGYSKTETLSDACFVVDALGPAAAERQISTIVTQLLIPYKTIPDFQRGGDAATLDQIDRRFAWFRRLLKDMDCKFAGIFPSSWALPHRLVIEFLQYTRIQILELLGSGDPQVENVTVLLKALQKTIQFEKSMRLEFEAETDMEDPKNSIDELVDSEGNLVDSQSAKGIRMKYERMNRANLKSQADVSPQNRQLPPLVGVLSKVFDPFMEPYISLERNNMNDMMRKLIEDEKVEEGGPLPLYTSSVQTFAYIKNSVKRCIALTNGQTFYKLQLEFKECLANYVELLGQKMTSCMQKMTSSAPGDATLIAEICYTVNTAEYCADTVPQLEELIKSKIDASYTAKIDLTVEQDLFYDVIAAAIRNLVAGLELKVEPALKALATINWGTFSMVGEESDYVRAIHSTVEAYVPTCRSVLSALYFRNFCDKFAAALIPKFLNLILKMKRISEEGTQQLLLDVYNLKKVMLDLPMVGGEESNTALVPMSYKKYVEKCMSKIEKVLKLVGTPVVMLVERFRIMWPEGGMRELQNIMSLKGMKRTEQASVLETFGGTTNLMNPVASSERQKEVAMTTGTTSSENMVMPSSSGSNTGGFTMKVSSATLSKKAESTMKGMKGAMDDFSKAFR